MNRSKLAQRRRNPEDDPNDDWLVLNRSWWLVLKCPVTHRASLGPAVHAMRLRIAEAIAYE